MKINIFLCFLIIVKNINNSNGFVFSGATAPLGFWDPLEISKKTDIGHLAFLRDSELKHSRWSMISLITIPMIESKTHYPAIHEFDNLSIQMKCLIIVLIGIGELNMMLKGWKNPFNNIENLFKLKERYQPGDFGFGVIQNLDYIEHDTINNLELNHGRFAMITSIIVFLLENIYRIPLFSTANLELIN